MFGSRPIVISLDRTPSHTYVTSNEILLDKHGSKAAFAWQGSLGLGLARLCHSGRLHLDSWVLWLINQTYVQRANPSILHLNADLVEIGPSDGIEFIATLSSE